MSDSEQSISSMTSLTSYLPTETLTEILLFLNYYDERRLRGLANSRVRAIFNLYADTVFKQPFEVSVIYFAFKTPEMGDLFEEGLMKMVQLYPQFQIGDSNKTFDGPQSMPQERNAKFSLTAPMVVFGFENSKAFGTKGYDVLKFIGGMETQLKYLPIRGKKAREFAPSIVKTVCSFRQGVGEVFIAGPKEGGGWDVSDLNEERHSGIVFVVDNQVLEQFGKNRLFGGLSFQ